MWIFRFVLTHFAQNDNALVILNFAEQIQGVDFSLCANALRSK